MPEVTQGEMRTLRARLAELEVAHERSQARIRHLERLAGVKPLPRDAAADARRAARGEALRGQSRRPTATSMTPKQPAPTRVMGSG